MKKIFTLLFSLPIFLFAQSPNGISYQGVATDITGAELINQSISLKVSILSSTATGPAQYVEEHNISTDEFGLFTTTIGQGNYVSGVSATIKDIAWGENPHFLKVEMDENGGTNYTNMGTSQIMTVPYAFYAEEAGKIRDGSKIKTLIYLGGM